ncbi:MAG: hypothetical protein IKZ46_12155, partial [Victivallales bacterium]|nr:hypothetical protein [Victivallales bacterium]
STSQGIPVVDPDTGDVVIHNTGVMIRRAMAEKGTDKDYNEKLAAEAKRLKVPFPDDARIPMLIAYLPEGMSRDAKIEQAKKGNLTTTRSVDAGQRAAADATVFATDEGRKVLSMLPDADSDRLVSEANSTFVKAAYAMLAKEDGDLVDGRPTDKFNDRLENAMMSLLFSGLKEEDRTRLVGDLVNDARNLGLADFKSALAVKAAKLNLIALKNKDFDLRPELSKATRDIVKWKRSGMKFAGDYANQMNFDPSENMPDADKPIFLALGNASQVSSKAVRQVLDAYIEGARAELQGQTLIGDKVTKGTLVQRMADTSAEIISSRKYSLGGQEERIDKGAFQRYINSLNEKKKPYSPQSNLDIDYEERNDAHSQGEKANQANAKKDAVDCLRRCGGSLLGLSVTKDYKSVSATSLVGKTIASAEDLADAAQIYRNPHFETFRYVFVKDGKVVYANAATSRMPGASVAFVGNDANQFLDRLKAEYDKSGADGYYLLHNHPSGTMAISGPDVNVTAAIIKNFKNRNFLGHVVIDHKQYSVIDAMGQIREALPLSPSTDENQYDPSKNPSMPNAMLGMTLVNPRQVAFAAKKIQDADSLPNGSLVLFGTTPQLKITCIASLPIIGMKSISEARLYALARQLSRASSSANFFLANVPPKDEKYVLPALRSGLLLDASLSDGTSIREKHMIPIKSYEYLGLDLKGKSAVTEKDAVRHSLSDAELKTAAKNDGIDLDKETQEFRDVYARYRGTKQWMKAPNGKDSKLTARQWIQVRTPSFKKWAGDWEMVSNATPDIDVRSYDEGREVLLKLSGKDMESGDGLHAILSHASIDKIFSGKAVSKSVSHHAHIAAAANLEKLYSHSRELHTPEEGNRQGIKYMHRLYAPFLFDGQPLLVKISVKEFTSGESNKLYTIEAMDIEKPAGILVPERSESGTDTPAQATEDKVHQLLDDFKESIEKSTKIIDENGEPMVVYHGTKSRFYEFTDVKMGKGGAKNNRDGNLYGNGYYFTDDYYSAQTYGRRVLECFLNIRNPSRTSTMGPENDGLMVNSGFHKTYLATSPTQIKSATDNVGTFSGENQDIRYSLVSKEDDKAYMDAVNNGDTKTAQKMVDKVAQAAGYTTKAYHGTPNGTFNVFRGWQYFTEDKTYADVYQKQGASSNGYKQTADKPRTYGVYLKTDKPFDTRNNTEREIFEDEFFGKWGNGTPLTEKGLPDWTDGDDLVEFFEENSYDYNVIYLDEGATGGYGNEVKDRGVAIVIKNPEQIKSADPITYDEDGKVIPLSKRFNKREPDIRYSLTEAQKKAAEGMDLNLDNETQEFRDVFAKYQGTKQWMKAPNGSKTNLSPRQWVQVHTPSFKKWFGDWENEEQNTSSVVDENGEPKPVYHGTTNGAFTVFDKNRIGERWNADEVGFFFTSSESIGIDYTIPYGKKDADSHLFYVYLNIKKPLKINSKWFRENYSRNISKYDAIEIWDNNQADILDAFNQGDYDGIIIDPTGMGMPQPKMYVAMEPNQIKSVTDNVGTFSSEDPDIRYSLVTDRKIDEEFNEDGKYITTYRSALLGDDGKLYPPMATKGGEGMELGKAYKSEEHPELINKKGKFPLKSDMRDSGEKGSVGAAYNPYFHSQPGVLNDQFAVAYDKSRMVTVKCRVLKSDIESGYRAEGAKDPVGYAKWATSGPVTRQMRGRGGRSVILSRYIMPVEIIPDAEVARMIKDYLGDNDITVPWNVVTPSLRE